MVEKLFKSLSIKIIAGAVVVVIIVLGLLLLGEKQPQSSKPQNRIPEVKKIPKPPSTVQPSLEKNSTKSMPSEAVSETTTNREISELDESVLNSENPLESEKGDKPDSISVEEMTEETNGPMSIHENETDELPGMEAGGEIVGEEPTEETGLRISEEPEAEKPAVKEEPEPKTLIAEKKQLVPEHDEKNIIRDIVLSESGSEQKLIFQTDSPIIKYKYFILSNPPRLVVDLPGVWKDPDFFEKKVDSSLVSRIRLWNHGDKLRIVNDLKSDKTLFPAFTKSSDGVEVVLKTR